LSQKSLKIPKGKSESINLRRTDNTMAKRKSTKGQTIYQMSLHPIVNKIHFLDNPCMFSSQSLHIFQVLNLYCGAVINTNNDENQNP
jgi:hypothetical protein